MFRFLGIGREEKKVPLVKVDSLDLSSPKQKLEEGLCIVVFKKIVRIHLVNLFIESIFMSLQKSICFNK